MRLLGHTTSTQESASLRRRLLPCTVIPESLTLQILGATQTRVGAGASPEDVIMASTSPSREDGAATDISQVEHQAHSAANLSPRVR